MTPLAAAFALAVGLGTLTGAARPEMPLSGVYGTSAGVAAPGGSKPARGGKRPYRLRAEAFVPGMPAADGPTGRRVLPPFTGDTATFPDAVEVVFFSNTRPVRVRVTARLDGKPLAAAWDAHLRKLFAGFDRDGDGVLNWYEAEHVFSARGVGGLLTGAHYYRSPTAPPTFDELDRDADNRVAFPEFAAYYSAAAEDLVRPRHVPVQAANARQLTHELFAKLDQDKNGKLTRGEVALAEKILVTSDADDDECLTPLEILPTLFGQNPRRPAATTAVPVPDAPGVSTDLSVYRGPLPGEVTASLVKRYDANKDDRLTRQEVGLEADVFARLDADADGKLSAKEAEAWRAGPPDFEVVLNLAKAAKDCSAVVRPGRSAGVPPAPPTGGGDVSERGETSPPPVGGAGGTPALRPGLPPDVEVREGSPGRLVLRVGKQFLDLSVSPPPSAGQRNRDALQLVQSFPQDRAEVTDDAIAGPQFQFLRIVFDAADSDGNGRLTKVEFQNYLGLQQSTIDLALTLTYATRTPSLFQLMDENGDGRLGIRELRTAFDRLIVLEPAGGDVVTTAAVQPSAGVRLGQSAFVAQDPSQFGNPFLRDGPRGTRGPVWFVKMDRNGDGDVSRAEFLGPADDFAAIDANNDGLISGDEAAAIDKKARKK